MELTIYKKDGSERKTVNIDERSTEVRKFKSEDFVNLIFDLTEYVDFQIGDYIDINGANYTLNQLPKVIKQSTTDYEYTCWFESPMYDLIGVIYKGTDGKIDHYLSGTVSDFVGLIVDNLNDVYGSGTWSSDVSITESGEYRNLHFKANNCLQVIQKVCKQYNIDFRIDNVNKTIIVRDEIGVDTGITLEYGSGGGLYEITRQRVDSQNLITRLYARGSDKNLTYEYESNEGRLKLPDIDGDGSKDDYIESNTGTYGVIEKSLIFENVYPHYKGNVTDIDTSEPTIFYDTNIDFDLNDYLISGMSPKIHFNTGDLAGYEFKVAYDHSSNKFTLSKFTTDQGLELPNDTLKPSDADGGDEYVILNIQMPDSYISDAETELKNKAQDYLDKNDTPRVQYNVAITPYEFEDNPYDLAVGDKVTIDDPQFGTKTVRITKRTKTLIENAAAGYDISIETSDIEGDPVSLTKVYQNQQRIANEILHITKKYEYQEYSISGTEENEFRIGDGGDGDKKLVFDDGTDRILEWQDGNARFNFSEPLAEQGSRVYSPNNIPTLDTVATSGNTTDQTVKIRGNNNTPSGTGIELFYD
uniref:phage tail protein n=1 Tax=Methanohalobium sp. TaxID=2837493 RepID=UPI0025D76D8A